VWLKIGTGPVHEHWERKNAEQNRSRPWGCVASASAASGQACPRVRVNTGVKGSHQRSSNSEQKAWGTGSHQAPGGRSTNAPCDVSQWWPWSFPYSRKKQLESTGGESTSTNCPSQEPAYLRRCSCMKIRMTAAGVCSSSASLLLIMTSWVSPWEHLEIESCSLPLMLQMHCNIIGIRGGRMSVLQTEY